MSENVNPWIVLAPKQTEQVPDGSYYASFNGVEEVVLPLASAKPGNDGSRWRFSWLVKTGPEANKIASALVDKALSSHNHAGRLITGLLGRTLVAGENVQASVDACKGKDF